MGKYPTDLEPLLSKADTLVENALKAEYRQDPILGGISRVHSIAKCITRSHGLLLEEAIAVALRRNGKIEVSRGVRFPITAAARSLVASNPVETLDRVRLAFDAEANSNFDLDLAAVTTDGSRAWAVDIKRGAGSTSGTRRAQVERELLAVKVLLRSFFRQQGYAVDDIGVAVIDVYGGGGFGAGLTVTRHGIDQFFGVPVLEVIDALEERLRQRLDIAWANLVSPPDRRPDASSPNGPEGPAGDPGDDTPVAPTRTRWADAFAIRSKQAAARPRLAVDGTRMTPAIDIDVPGTRGPSVLPRPGVEHWKDAVLDADRPVASTRRRDSGPRREAH